MIDIQQEIDNVKNIIETYMDYNHNYWRKHKSSDASKYTSTDENSNIVYFSINNHNQYYISYKNYDYLIHYGNLNKSSYRIFSGNNVFMIPDKRFTETLCTLSSKSRLYIFRNHLNFIFDCDYRKEYSIMKNVTDEEKITLIEHDPSMIDIFKNIPEYISKKYKKETEIRNAGIAL